MQQIDYSQYLTPMENSQLSLWGNRVGDQEKSPIFIFSYMENNPRISIITNRQDKDGKKAYPIRIGQLIFLEMLNELEHMVKDTTLRSSRKFINKDKDGQIESTLVIVRDNRDVICFKTTYKDNNDTFPILPNKWTSLVDGLTNEPLKAGEVSRIRAESFLQLARESFYRTVYHKYIDDKELAITRKNRQLTRQAAAAQKEFVKDIPTGNMGVTSSISDEDIPY